MALAWVSQKLLSLVAQLDHEAFDLLKPHAHKIIAVQIEGFNTLAFHIAHDGRPQLMTPPLAPYDTTFRGSLSAFVNALHTTHPGVLYIHGDISCAKACMDTLAHLDLDVEGLLARGLGDWAYFVAQGFRHAQIVLRDQLHARRQDFTRYLQHEAKLLPTKEEVDIFYQDVDTLRLDVARLEARQRILVDHLAKRVMS